MDIRQKQETVIVNQELIDGLSEMMLTLPQSDAPVAHYFGPGVYVRQVTFPANIFAIGHKQRFETLNIFVHGRVAMIQPDGNIKELQAPMIFTSPPGQKMGLILETVTWLNVYPNPDNERDIDILEDRFLDKNGPWREHDHSVDRMKDNEDFEKIKDEISLPVLDDDQCEDIPDGFNCVLTIRKSDIHGKGVFTSWPFEQGGIVGPITINGKPTLISKYINHSASPNTQVNADGFLVALKHINGCRGGDQGEEITIDYRKGLTSCLEH